MILAMARAAGEVAPLMIVGMVKLAPALPVDGSFPFVHLERKFMHLGFHIYDVGFQSPNVEAAKPLVFATALLLIAGGDADEPGRHRAAQPPAAQVCRERRLQAAMPAREPVPTSTEDPRMTEPERDRMLRDPPRASPGRERAVAATRARPGIADPILEIDELSLWYGEKQALHDISLTIPEQARSPPSSAPRAAASRRCCAASTA